MPLKIRVHERLNESYNPRTCKIGSQVWSAENLDVDDGGEGIYKHNGETYYTWDAAMRVAESIPGWRLPTKHEFLQLFKACGGERVAGKKLKSKSGWDDNGNGTDEYGFSAFPVGYKSRVGRFNNVGAFAYFWSASQDENYSNISFRMYLDYYYDDACVDRTINDDGCTVRLIKD